MQTPNGSRFVECPVCLQKVAHYLINSHLDYECGRSTSSLTDVKTEATAATQLYSGTFNRIATSSTRQGHCWHTQVMVDVHLHIALILLHGCRGDRRCTVAKCSTSTVTINRQRNSFAATAMVGSKSEATGVHTKQVSHSLVLRSLLNHQKFSTTPCCHCIPRYWDSAARLRWHRQKGRKQPLSDEELRRATPCELVRDVLPKGLAEELLVLLLAASPSWQRGQWTMFGKTHAAPRTSCYYSLDADGVRWHSTKCA